MEKDCIVRSYDPDDEKQIVPLLQMVFDGWPRFDLKYTPLEFWKWKYHDNPMNRIVLPIAVCDDKVVGCCHLIQQKMKIGDRVFLSGNEADVAVHPDFRRMGIYNKMKSLQNEIMKKVGVKFLYGVESNPILINKNIKRGHEVIFPYLPTILVRIHDVKLHLRMMPTDHAWLKKYGFHIFDLFNKIQNSLIKHDSSVRDFRISDIKQFDSLINIFWDEIKDHYNFIIERTKDYLNWRYCDSRGGKYLVKISEDNNRILGYSVLRINRYKKEYPIGYFVDLLTIPNRPDVADALIEEAINYFDSNNINISTCLIIKNNLYESIFKRYGFIDSRFRPLTNYSPSIEIDKEIKKFHTSTTDKIHFVYGDYDAI